MSAGSIELLGKVKEPISVTVYTAASSETGKAATDFLTPYQRTKPNIKLSFIDPAEQPMLARQAGIQREGEMIVQVGKRTEHLTSYNESAFTNLLMRLARDKERLGLYLDGHAERSMIQELRQRIPPSLVGERRGRAGGGGERAPRPARAPAGAAGACSKS